MFPRRLRFGRRKDVLATIRQGQRLSTPHVRIYIRQLSGQKHTRVACVVGKKVDASAVKRHRIQRWLREIARQAVLPLSLPVDTVWMALPSARNLQSKAELEESLRPYLLKIEERIQNKGGALNK